MVNENLVSYFPVRAYDSIDDLAETFMNLTNCRSSAINLSRKTILTLLSLNPYTFTRILSNQICLEILMCDYKLLCLPIGLP